MKLITESDIMDYEVIKESHSPDMPETIKMRGVYLQSEVKNGNSRIYPYDILKESVDKFIMEKVETKQALEELEHPETTIIDPKRVCSRTLSLVEDNKSWIGESVILASDPKHGILGTPCGDLVKSLLQFDTAIGHSSRGIGDVDEKTGLVKEYQLICIDTVLSPSIGIFNKSNATRFVNGILESKEFIINTHGEILEKPYQKFEKCLSKMPNTYISSKKADVVGKALKEFLDSLT